MLHNDFALEEVKTAMRKGSPNQDLDAGQPREPAFDPEFLQRPGPWSSASNSISDLAPVNRFFSSRRLFKNSRQLRILAN